MSEYLDGELPLGVRQKVDAHLETCGSCRRRYEQASLLIQEVKGREKAKLPPYFLPKLVRALDETKPVTSITRLVPKLAIGLASLLVILAILIPVLRRPISDVILEEATTSDGTIYLSTLEEGGEVFTITGKSFDEDSVLYLLRSSPPKVEATLVSH